MTLEEQMNMFDKYGSDCYDELVKFMVENRFSILRKAKERLIAGYPIYGDRMWTWEQIEREDNIIEELADAINYTLSRL